MDEKNINLQALEGDQNKVERNGDKKISSEGGLERGGPNPVQTLYQWIEATQELEPEEKGNQEGTCVGFASTLRVTPVPFDLNVVDGEAHLLLLRHHRPIPPPHPSVPQPFIENFDRNDTEETHIHNDSLLHGAEPDASVFRIMGTNVDIKKTKVFLKLCLRQTMARLFIFLGTISVEWPKGATSSPLSVVQPPPLSLSCLTSTGPSALHQLLFRPPPFSHSCLSSTGGTETKEPESDVRGMAVMATCSPSAIVDPPPLSLSCLTSTGGTKRKEPEGSQEPYVPKRNRACSC
ncbi:hypothetical protein M0R45_012403 [Rubus argutus]|uniref:Uncharacterized protein n=1 Tax=Rubus argutus TaxID=59490 RepID=A0AAW1YCK2_RUBAR